MKKLSAKHRRFLMPDTSSRVDAIGWNLGDDGLTIRLNDHDSGCFWSWNKSELNSAAVFLANLIEPLQSLQRELSLKPA